MFGNLGELAKMMSKLKDIQQSAARLKEELPQLEFASSGRSNLVQVVVGGDFTIRKIEIVPGGTADRFELQKELEFALDQALSQAKTELMSRVQKAAGGIDLSNFLGRKQA